MIRVALIGAAGRMGQAISRLAGDQIVARIVVQLGKADALLLQHRLHHALIQARRAFSK